ncbi:MULTISPECIES: aspartate aminotransferase family protein [Rhizobium]|uniref:aspartate aminotransferase family protein n=1 Tax=Rhizobium TaxID=379 RepID=UPI000BBDEA5D|nr:MULTISPECIES: aminotransferase class III-fold pyridoxal phosphate-dependent enzyme [Rhizobium]PCK83130.1 aspartate aminotransferase family protein [Rhizobium sophoriradicis]PDS73604.1 aspartate aminotransferase family protein [Rhizobium sp. L43]ULJ82404.1 aminotransferase class III-fold pyridoxal phosphate-dependent enzyme [Rhizobium sp. C104]
MPQPPAQQKSSLDAALLEARERYNAKRPKSAALHREAINVLPGGNTRSVLAYAPFPTAMARGEGCRLWDIDGNAYLDLCGEYTAGLFGHTDSRIHAALHDAMAKGLSLAAVGEAEQRLAKILCNRFPSIDMIRFTNSGTEANLIALSAAQVVTERKRIIAFRGGYHGSLLYYPVTGSSLITAPFPVTLCDYNDTDGTVAAIRAIGDDLAAVIVEPMMGSGGCIAAEPAFLAAVAEATRAAGAILIFDEVMTSRMSGGGLQERLGILPDMTTLGKYIGGGMSFGAFGGRHDLMEIFVSKVLHAGTFNNNVMSMAAGVTAMEEVFTAAAAAGLFALGEGLRERHNSISNTAGAPLQFCGLGSLATAHFRRGRIDRPYAVTPREEALKELFFFDMLDAGIYIARRGMTALSLPTTERDLAHFTAAVGDFLDARAALLR